jgi:long-chain fatty acid transport protein
MLATADLSDGQNNKPLTKDNNTMAKQLLLLALIICSIGKSYAASPYQPEIATSSSIGTAGAANPTHTYDASVIRTNPAGLPHLSRPETLKVGAQVLNGIMRFDAEIAEAGGTDKGNAAPSEIIPGIFYSRQLNDKWHMGAGVAAAYGLGAEYGDAFSGRYLTITTSLAGAGVYSSLGYQINDEWSIGLSLAAIHTTLTLSRAVSKNPSAPSVATDGKMKFDEIDDWSPQATAGLLYTPNNSQWTMGFVYRSKTEVDLKGDLKAYNGITLPSDTGKVSFDMPEVFEIGASYQYSNNLSLFFQADLQRWSQFSDYTIDIGAGPMALNRDWRDSYRVSLGAHYQLSPTRSFFVGTGFDMSAVTDKNRTFDAPVDDQIRATGAYVYQADNLDVSFGLTVIHGGKGKIDQNVEVAPGSGQFSRIKGEFSTYYVLFGFASIDYRF